MGLAPRVHWTRRPLVCIHDRRYAGGEKMAWKESSTHCCRLTSFDVSSQPTSSCLAAARTAFRAAFARALRRSTKKSTSETTGTHGAQMVAPAQDGSPTVPS